MADPPASSLSALVDLSDLLAPTEPCKSCGHPLREKRLATSKVTNLDSMAETARGGCLVCLILLKGSEEIGLSRPTTESVTVHTITDPATNITFKVADDEISYFLSPDSPNPQGLLRNWGVQHDLPASTSSDVSVKWCLERLSDCKDNHPQCARLQGALAPARLLDLGVADGDTVRLVTLVPGAVIGRYACLSHCWGRRPPLRTLSSNLAAHHSEVPWATLPPAFRDAVTLTRRLGVRRLWIDSLCIVQDDDGDWRREGSRMADIFSGAYVTIASMHASSAEGGLFAAAPRPDFAVRELLAVPRGGREPAGSEAPVRVCARRHVPHVNRHQLDFSNISNRPRYFPLLGRGWVFQERLLSTRTLLFGAHEISWECIEETSCQCSGANVARTVRGDMQPSWMNVGGMIRPKLQYRPWAEVGAEAGASLEPAVRAAVSRSWHSLVEEYSHLDLTFDRDVFPALSGLAKEYGRFLGPGYAAGIWEADLPLGLLWYADNGRQEAWAKGRPAAWCAPTWSWASIRGAVAFVQVAVANLSRACEVVEVAWAPAGSDPTGELEGGHVVLRGLLLRTALRHLQAPSGQAPVASNRFRLDLFCSGDMPNNTRADYDTTREGPGYVPDGSEVACLHIGLRTDTWASLLLILRPVAGVASSPYPTFERIGFLEIFGLPATEDARFKAVVESAAQLTTVMVV